MKIALFSDIHANLPALHSFFNSIYTHKPDALYCLGDLVGYHIWPNEVISNIRHRGIATLAGNHDSGDKYLSNFGLPKTARYSAAVSGDINNVPVYLAFFKANPGAEFSFKSALNKILVSKIQNPLFIFHQFIQLIGSKTVGFYL